MQNATKAIMAMMAFLLLSCSPKTVYIPVQTSSLRTDTVQRIIRIHTSDTIREKEYISDLRYDSIAPILDSLNRVTGWDRYHFRESTKMSDRERMSLLATIDSLRQTKADSIYIEKPYPVEKIVEVERKKRWWETALLWTAGLGLAIFALSRAKRN